MKQMQSENSKKNKLMQFVDSNILLSTERRLTLANFHLMTEDNLNILR